MTGAATMKHGGRIAARSALLSVPLLLIASTSALSQSGFRFEAMQAALKGEAISSPGPQGDDPVGQLAAFLEAAPHTQSPHRRNAQESAPSPDDVHQREAEQPQLISAEAPGQILPGDGAIAALAAFAAQIEGRDPSFKFAEAKAKATKASKAPAKASADDEATFVGAQVCLGCHTAQAAAFNQTIMGRIFRNPRNAQERGGCETCHGAGSLHVKLGGGRGVGGIISFRKDDHSRSVADNNAICMSCHDKGDRLHWQGSTHETRDVACTNCHTVMANVSPKSNLKTAVEVDTCFQCHKNKRAEMWRSSHMPVREGKMTCTSCHNPHGSFGESLLKEATINDNCYKCHAEKRGPFLFEHAPVRENCTNCHEPHGSNNDFLLKISRPRLCQQCHSALSGHPANPRNPVSVYAIGRECQNCHSQHHGSNSPSGARFQR
jgi:DmsE family decaheme c-type cytochrome